MQYEFQIPFSLCLRVWDIYLLDGERVVTAMAYTILRLHKNKILKLKDMDLIVQYLQVSKRDLFVFIILTTRRNCKMRVLLNKLLDFISPVSFTINYIIFKNANVQIFSD